MELLTEILYQYATVFFIFFALTIIGTFMYNKIRVMSKNFINMNELLPEDEIHSLRQVFYLILMALCFLNIFYSFIGFRMEFIYYFVIYDIILSLYCAISLDKSSVKNKIIWLLLIPYGSLCYTLFNLNLVIYLDLLHILIFIYFTKLYFDKFMEYTDSYGLGITILLLFVIIFSSFILIQYAENVNALDSLVMVSNQFTGNGFAVFGDSIPGKLNSLLLVWGGYVISGASAATLTAAILIKHFKKRFEELEKLIEGADE